MRQQRITQLRLKQILTTPKHIRIEVIRVGNLRHQQVAGANGPVPLVEFGESAPTVARLIGRKIECTRGPDRPVEKTGAWLVSIGIVVDEVRKEDPSSRKAQA